MQLTPQAQKLWEKLPNEVRVKLLNNVYCVTCRKSIGIANATGVVERGDLILKGICLTCGGPVARLVESS